MPHAHPSTRHVVSSFSLPLRFQHVLGRSRSGWLLLLAFTACLLLGSGRTSAQNVQHTKNAPGIGMRSVFKVNPATNALEFQVPLGPTGYPQRGGSVAPSIDYSSRIWRIAYLGPINGTPTQQGPPPVVGTRVVPRLAENSRMGWTYSLEAPYVETTAQDAMGGEVYDAWGNSLSMCTVGSGAACCFIDRVRIHMPGGGTQEFRSSDHPVCYDEAGHTPQLPDKLYSVDGSRMRFQRSTNKLFLPDGSYWVLATPTTAAQLFDRNGNRLLNGLTDDLGRTFANPIDPTLGTDYTYTVPGVGGSTLAYTFRWRSLDQVQTVPLAPGQALPNFSDDCGNTVCADPYLFKSDTGADQPVKTQGGSSKINPLVLYQIVLPHDPSNANPPTYTFTYNVYAEIDKVVYPTGGYERFQYGLVEPQQSGTFVYAEGNRGVTDRWVSARGDGSDEAHWQYAWTDSQGQLRRGEISPDGTRTERSVYYTSFGITFWSYTDARAGRPTEERVYNPAGQLIRRKLSEWAVTGSDNCSLGAYSSCTATRNPRLTKTVEIIIEPGVSALAKTTTYGYDLTYQFTTGINQTSVNEYDYVVVDLSTAQTGAVGSFPMSAQPLRKTETAYLDATNAAYRDRNILGLPTSVEVKNGAGTLAAKSTTSYDESDYQLVNNYGAVANWTDPGSLRGNATTASRWLNTTGGYVQTHAQYDQVGNVVVSWDANGNQTQTTYSPTFGYAFPTSVTTAAPNPDAVPNPDGGSSYGAGAFGSTTGFTAYSDYDPSTGLVVSTTDANYKTTTYNYTDPLNRLKLVTGPDGGTTTYNYGRYNNAGRVSDYVSTATSLDSSRSIISYQYFDGLGRPDRSFLSEGGSPAQYLTSDTQYDALGRVWKVSNPHRTTGSDSAVNPSGLWTTSEYDALGRVKMMTTPDGAAMTTAYNGLEVSVTDQVGRKRSSLSDALGRLAQVTEDPTPGGLNYLTVYTYDVLGNLKQVTQGEQPARVFTYNSLSRLTSAQNPESGTVAYGYDAAGNLTSRTDARGVQTTYTYDRLNRNILTYYTGITPDTPTILRKYDFGVNGKGRPYLTQQSGSITSATYFDQYDETGQLLVQRRKFETAGVWSADYKVTRTYNLAGGVTSQTYPSGHKVTYNYDAAGRISDSGTQPSQRAFFGTLGDGVERTYADQLTYSEFGGIEQERFGTQTALFHKLHYNTRGQLFDIRLSTVAWASDPTNWNRGAVVNYYSSNYAWEGNPATPPAPDNNGNLRLQQSFVPGDDSYNGWAYAQDTFEYDALNRLTRVSELHGGAAGQSTQDFAQGYTYDRWGNRTINLSQTTGAPNKQFDLNPTGVYREVAEPSNRLYATGDNARLPQDKLMRYDAAGNLVYDAYSDGGGGARVYDAENRMTAAVGRDGNWDYYTYDADGRRVRRKIANEEWWQVYGMGGELLAEYRAGAATFLPSKEYGYRGGELLVTMASGDDQRLRRFVQNLYYGALRRDPTAQELQDKSNDLAAAGAQSQAQLLQTAKNLARSLFTQTTYETAPSRTEAQYVADLYYTYLQRAPDDSGLSGWAGAAAGGVPNRSNVCDAFQESLEFAAVVSTLYGSAVSDDERTDRLIQRFYLATTGAFASASDLQQKRAQLNAAAAQGPEAVKAAAESMGRSLFAAQVSDLSIPAQQFVTNLYEGFLQRGPDANGLSWWTGEAGTTVQGRQHVLDAFAVSEPFKELAGTLYRETFWLVTDQLGTPRMVADKTGGLAGVKRHDYLPFGEELYAGAGGRTQTQGYKENTDGNRKRWAQLERDDETELDYAQARYYSSKLGRFTSPDEFAGGPEELFEFEEAAAANPTFYAEPANPQTLNKYSYAYNNPQRFVDPNGHQGTELVNTIINSPPVQDIGMGIAKSVANTGISFNNWIGGWWSNVTRSEMKEATPLYRADNNFQALGMKLGYDVTTIGSFMGGRKGPTGVLVADSKAAALEATVEQQLSKRHLVTPGNQIPVPEGVKMADFVATAKSEKSAVVAEVHSGHTKSMSTLRQQLENGIQWARSQGFSRIKPQVHVSDRRYAGLVARSFSGGVRGTSEPVKVILHATPSH